MENSGTKFTYRYLATKFSIIIAVYGVEVLHVLLNLHTGEDLSQDFFARSTDTAVLVLLKNSSKFSTVHERGEGGSDHRSDSAADDGDDGAAAAVIVSLAQHVAGGSGDGLRPRASLAAQNLGTLHGCGGQRIGKQLSR